MVAKPAAKEAARAAGEAVAGCCRVGSGGEGLFVLSLEGVLSGEEIAVVVVLSGVVKPPMYPIVSGRTERVQGERLVTRPAPRTIKKLSGVRPVSCAATRSSACVMRLNKPESAARS